MWVSARTTAKGLKKKERSKTAPRSPARGCHRAVWLRDDQASSAPNSRRSSPPLKVPFGSLAAIVTVQAAVKKETTGSPSHADARRARRRSRKGIWFGWLAKGGIRMVSLGSSVILSKRRTRIARHETHQDLEATLWVPRYPAPRACRWDGASKERFFGRPIDVCASEQDQSAHRG